MSKGLRVRLPKKTSEFRASAVVSYKGLSCRGAPDRDVRRSFSVVLRCLFITRFLGLFKRFSWRRIRFYRYSDVRCTELRPGFRNWAVGLIVQTSGRLSDFLKQEPGWLSFGLVVS